MTDYAGSGGGCSFGCGFGGCCGDGGGIWNCSGGILFEWNGCCWWWSLLGNLPEVFLVLKF